MNNNDPEEKILTEEEMPTEKPQEIEKKPQDTLMEQIKDLRLEQKIDQEELIPEIQKQKQNFYVKNQKVLFIVLFISGIINVACFAVLLFL